MKEAQTNFHLEIIPTIGISEETNPSKGQGYEIVPVGGRSLS